MFVLGETIKREGIEESKKIKSILFEYTVMFYLYRYNNKKIISKTEEGETNVGAILKEEGENGDYEENSDDETDEN